MSGEVVMLEWRQGRVPGELVWEEVICSAESTDDVDGWLQTRPAVAEHNACVTALRAALAREADTEARRLKFDIALQSLTAMGSEFVNNPERCVVYVKERQQSQHELIKRSILEKKAALADAARLREALRLHTVDNSGCDVCQGRWPVDRPEAHAPGCLAAPP